MSLTLQAAELSDQSQHAVHVGNRIVELLIERLTRLRRPQTSNQKQPGSRQAGNINTRSTLVDPANREPNKAGSEQEERSHHRRQRS